MDVHDHAAFVSALPARLFQTVEYHSGAVNHPTEFLVADERY
jgi:hypothetical protein